MQGRWCVLAKSGLVVLTFGLLSLITACSNSSVTPEYGGSAIEDITTLEKVTLVVPTIF